MLTVRANGSYTRVDDPGEPSTGVARISIAPDEAIILADLATGRDVLEIGTGLGVSTRALATNAASVTTVDIDQWVHDTIWPELPDNVTGCTRVPDGRAFGMVFVDGDHSTVATARDIATAWARLVPGGIIAVHDAHAPDVAAALAGAWTIHDTTYGLAVQVVE